MPYDEELAGRLRAALSFEPDITEKRMFGGCAFLAGGHLAAAAASSGQLMVRVDPRLTPGLVDGRLVRRFRMNGRELDGWLLVEQQALPDEAGLRRWLELGLAHARSLPAARSTRPARVSTAGEEGA